MTRLRSAVLPVALLLCLTACGSTVQVRGSATVESGSGTGLTQPTAGSVVDGSPSVVPGGGSTSTGPGSLTPTGALGPTAGGSASTAPGAGGAVGGAVPKTGRGWTEKEVYIGVVTQKDTQKTFATVGVDSVDPGDNEKQAQAAADEINAGGGILGRKVVLRFRDVAIIETNQNGDTVGQTVCSFFTQDNKVIAVWNVSTQLDQSPTLRTCLAKAGVAFFSTAARAIDDTLMKSLAPSYYHAIGVSWTRLAPALVARLKAQRYFTGWNTALGREDTSTPVIGVLVEDEPQGKRTAVAVTSALKAAGFGRVFVFAYARPEDGQGSSLSYFKGNGVTHVIVTDVELSAFQQSAASQQYKPRYGITTYNAPYPNLEGSGITPPGANNGALGVGWAPSLDVSESNQATPAPGWPRCAKAMTKRAQSFSGKRLAQSYAATMCDTFFLLDQGAEAGHGFTIAAIRAGIIAIGPGFRSAFSYGTSLGAATPYVPGVLRDLRWDTPCGCMRYGSTQTALPR